MPASLLAVMCKYTLMHNAIVYVQVLLCILKITHHSTIVHNTIILAVLGNSNPCSFGYNCHTFYVWLKISVEPGPSSLPLPSILARQHLFDRLNIILTGSCLLFELQYMYMYVYTCTCTCTCWTTDTLRLLAS